MNTNCLYVFYAVFLQVTLFFASAVYAEDVSSVSNNDDTYHHYSQQVDTRDVHRSFAALGVGVGVAPFSRFASGPKALRSWCKNFCLLTSSLALLGGYLYRGLMSRGDVFMSSSPEELQSSFLQDPSSSYGEYFESPDPHKDSHGVGWLPDLDDFDPKVRSKYDSLMNYVSEDGTEHFEYMEQYTRILKSIDNRDQRAELRRHVNYEVHKRQVAVKQQKRSLTFFAYYQKNATDLMAIKNQLIGLKELVEIAVSDVPEADQREVKQRFLDIFKIFRDTDTKVSKALSASSVAKMAALKISFLDLSTLFLMLNHDLSDFSKFLFVYYPHVHDVLLPALSSISSKLVNLGESLMALKNNTIYTVEYTLKKRKNISEKSKTVLNKLSKDRLFYANILEDDSTKYAANEDIFYSHLLEHSVNLLVRNLFHLGEMTRGHKLVVRKRLGFPRQFMNPDLRLLVSVVLLEVYMPLIEEFIEMSLPRGVEASQVKNKLFESFAKSEISISPRDILEDDVMYSDVYRSPFFVNALEMSLRIANFENFVSNIDTLKKMLEELNVYEISYLTRAPIPDDIVDDELRVKMWNVATEIFERTSLLLYYSVAVRMGDKINILYDELSYFYVLARHFSRNQRMKGSHMVSPKELQEKLELKNYFSRFSGEYDKFLRPEDREYFIQAYPHISALKQALFNAELLFTLQSE